MSTGKPNEERLMARLEAASLENIFELSEAELDAELKELGLDPVAEVARMRGVIDNAAKSAARAGLLSAKAEVARFRQSQPSGSGDPEAGRTLLERIRSRDPTAAEMMIAARKGKTLSERDEAGLAQDLADLEKLSRKPE
jgi:hypothetical protein